MTLYIMCGVGFSGKSTLAKKIAEHTKSILISQDALFFEKEKELNLSQDSEDDWRMVINMCRDKIKEELSKSHSVVFDDTSTKFRYREKLRTIAKMTGADTKVIFLDTPIEVQKERQLKNKISKERHDVKQEYLDDAIQELEIPTDGENVLVFKPDTNVGEFLKKLE